MIWRILEIPQSLPASEGWGGRKLTVGDEDLSMLPTEIKGNERPAITTKRVASIAPWWRL